MTARKTALKPDRDFAHEAVPADCRTGFGGLLVVMLGFTFFSASMGVGATLGTGLTLSRFVTAVVLGNAILGGYTAVLAYLAAKTHCSIHLLVRQTFGDWGTWLPSLLL